MNTEINVTNGAGLSTIFRRAAELSESIAAQQAELQQLLSGQGVDVSALTSLGTPLNTPASPKGTRKHRVFTPEGIAAIKAAQRRRWKNKRKAEKEASASIGSQIPPAPAPAQTNSAAPAAKPEPVAAAA